jgi:hypothetical protein
VTLAAPLAAPLAATLAAPLAVPPVVPLAELAAADWTRLIRGIAEAGARAEAAPGPAQAMIDRMLVRAARDGAQALAWAGRPLVVERVIRGAGKRGRARFVDRAELAAATATAVALGDVPVALVAIARAFADDTDRAGALVAMFLETGRRAEALADQLELARQADPALAPAAHALARSLPRARLRPFRPRVRSAADFDRMRATGYVDGKPGRVVQVARAGLAWHGHVLRKADVIVSETSP